RPRRSLQPRLQALLQSPTTFAARLRVDAGGDDIDRRREHRFVASGRAGHRREGQGGESCERSCHGVSIRVWIPGRTQSLRMDGRSDGGRKGNHAVSTLELEITFVPPPRRLRRIDYEST